MEDEQTGWRFCSMGRVELGEAMGGRREETWEKAIGGGLSVVLTVCWGVGGDVFFVGRSAVGFVVCVESPRAGSRWLPCVDWPTGSWEELHCSDGADSTPNGQQQQGLLGRMYLGSVCRLSRRRRAWRVLYGGAGEVRVGVWWALVPVWY
ncbi:hypothetical protein Tco_0163589 [Tanacetum coccineum]